MRTSSGEDVPGLVTKCIRKSRSLNSGKSDCRASAPTSTPTSRIVPTVRYGTRGRRMTSRQHAGRRSACSQRTTGDSRRSTCAPSSRMRPSAGVTVSATAIDASTARP